MVYILLLSTFGAIFGSSQAGSNISEASSLLTAITAISRRLERLESNSSITTTSNGNPFSSLPPAMQTILEDQEIETKEDLLLLEENDIKEIFTKIIHQHKAIALQKQFKEESQTVDNRSGQDIAILNQQVPPARTISENESSRQIRGTQVMNLIDQIIKDYRNSDNGSWTTGYDRGATPAFWNEHNPHGLRYLRDNLYFIDSLLKEGIDQSSSNILMDMLLDVIADKRQFRTIQPQHWIYTYWENKFHCPSPANGTKITEVSKGIYALIYIVAREGGDATLQKLHDRRHTGATPADNDFLNHIFEKLRDDPQEIRIRTHVPRDKLEEFVNIFNAEDGQATVLTHTTVGLFPRMQQMIRNS